MIILYYLGAELVTVSLGVGLSIKAVNDSIINVCNHGYKYNKEKICRENIEDKKVNSLKKLLGSVCLFIPGVNLIKPIMSLYKANNIYKDEDIIKILAPMTDYEKKKYSMINSKREKVAFSTALTAVGEYIESDEKRELRRQKEESEIEKLRRLRHDLSIQINDSQNMNNDIEELYEFANKQKVLKK